MPNRNYIKGIKKERKIIKRLKNNGYDIAHRSAGSHSPIDIFAISRKKRIILFIQSKPDNYPISKTEKLYKELNWINGEDWKVVFKVI